MGIADALIGGAGDGTPRSEGGDDVLNKGIGAGRIFGAGGKDIVDYSTSHAGVNVHLHDSNFVGVGGDATRSIILKVWSDPTSTAHSAKQVTLNTPLAARTATFSSTFMARTG